MPADQGGQSIAFTLQVLNESSVMLYLGGSIENETADKVSYVTAALRDVLATQVIDIVPSYTSILITYDCSYISSLDFAHQIRCVVRALRYQPQLEHCTKPIIELPVYYGLDVALDAAELSELHQLDFDEIVRLHTAEVYRVYAIGFSPGFAYLGNVDPRIASPRKATPRLNVPAGSVGIADTQTAIYPLSSPGGWQIIGRSPTKMIDWQMNPPTPVTVGDSVRFVAITKQEFLALGGSLDEL